MASTTFRSNSSTGNHPAPPVAEPFHRTPYPGGRWIDEWEEDCLLHLIQPCEHSGEYVYRCEDPETREVIDFHDGTGWQVGWRRFPVYAQAVQEALVWAGRSYPGPEDDSGPEGEMEAAFPSYCPSTGYVEDTVRVAAS